jgi:hypothetical protein
MQEFTGKEKMLQDWNRVLVSILRANEGECDIRHIRDDKEEVVGISAELELHFEYAVSDEMVDNYEDAVRIAKKQVSDLVTKEGEFTSKQRMIIDWMSMKNAIVRAQSGEMKIALHRNEFAGGLIIGVSVEVLLGFDQPLPETFSDEEKDKIDKAKK